VTSSWTCAPGLAVAPKRIFMIDTHILSLRTVLKLPMAVMIALWQQQIVLLQQNSRTRMMGTVRRIFCSLQVLDQLLMLKLAAPSVANALQISTYPMVPVRDVQRVKNLLQVLPQSLIVFLKLIMP